VRWHPGFMSAPHFYSTDRYCMVLSGIWWCNSGADFDPAACGRAGWVNRPVGNMRGATSPLPQPAI
jgi:hypothetical protein